MQRTEKYHDQRKDSEVPKVESERKASKESTPSPPRKERLLPLDALRGLIMVLMALDHASYYIAEVHPEEFWGTPLPLYASTLAFLTRWITHLAAPGFFFLMGVSMVLFAESRRNSGWSEGKISRYLAFRGLLLIVIQEVLINPAWTLASSSIMGETMPGGGGKAFWPYHAGVLYGLGASMIVCAFLLRYSSAVLTCVSFGAILATQVLIPPPEKAAVLYSPLIRLLLIPGQTGVWQVYYPLIPWLGLPGMGIVFGRELLRDRRRAYTSALIFGLGSLFLFAVLRYSGFPVDFHPLSGKSQWIAFLNLTKYPPSLGFILLTLGMNMVLLYLLSRAGNGLEKWGDPLLTFGKTALFFYILHLYLYALIGSISPGRASIALVYPWCLIGLLLLYPLCKWYGNFKQRTPPDSVWRFF
ncbi:MAG: heparan-alpha-glucosaminide N-acetyltransferase domain-containing protein [bacterium]